ncbi:RDD family protein [Candidatus Gottesmanbacteria bacterium]|nr:RDD family protein [Candidatus Gottesmanbacteria bacterium]
MMGKVNQPAGFFIRFIGYFIDIALFWTALLLFLFFSGLSTKNLPQLIGSSIVAISIFGILGGFIYYFYLAFTTSRFGATVGKMLVGVIVKNEAGNYLTFKQGLFRYIIGYTVSSLLFGLGFLWIIRDPKKQGWHDMVSGSYVTKTSENRWIIGVLALLFLIAFNSFIGVGIIQSVIENPNAKRDVEEIINQVKDTQPQQLYINPSPQFYPNNY